MKTKLFLATLFSLFLSISPNVFASNTDFSGGDPDVKVVVSPKRIWLVADEMSVKSLTVQVLNEQDKVVMEKQLSSKMTDWSLRIESLPKGKYSVKIGDKIMTEFQR